MEIQLNNDFKHNLYSILLASNIKEDKADRLLKEIKIFYTKLEKLRESQELKDLYQTCKKPDKKAYIIACLLQKSLTNKQISSILDVPNSTIEYLKRLDKALDYTFREKVLKLIK